MARSFHSALRSLVLSRLTPEEELQLTSSVRVENNSMLGYGDIDVVYRHGKNGAVRCADRFNNMYYLSELSEAQCRAILEAIPN